jgi:hypothetical protein
VSGAASVAGIDRSAIVKAVLPIAIGLVIWFLPVPDAVGSDSEPLVAPDGMHMLGIFVGTIVGLITRPLPTAAVSIIGLSVAMITGTPSPALAGFSNPTVWLIVAAFFISDDQVLARVEQHLTRPKPIGSSSTRSSRCTWGRVDVISTTGSWPSPTTSSPSRTTERSIIVSRLP